MRRLIVLFCVAAVVMFGINAFAKEKEITEEVKGTVETVEIPEAKHGFIIGGGPMLGFEMSNLKRVDGGALVNAGYLFKNGLSIMLRGDLIYTREWSTNYFFFPIMPTLKYTFNTGFFGSVGGGYTPLWIGKGHRFNSATVMPSKIFNGFSVYASGGYDLWLRDNIFISPQIGFYYMRVASQNLFSPMVQVTANLLF